MPLSVQAAVQQAAVQREMMEEREAWGARDRWFQRRVQTLEGLREEDLAKFGEELTRYKGLEQRLRDRLATLEAANQALMSNNDYQVGLLRDVQQQLRDVQEARKTDAARALAQSNADEMLMQNATAEIRRLQHRLHESERNLARVRRERNALRQTTNSAASSSAPAPAVPASAPAVPASAPAVPTSAPAVPASAPSIAAPAPAVPASAPTVPASAPTVPASAPTVSASAPTVPASAPAVDVKMEWPDKVSVKTEATSKPATLVAKPAAPVTAKPAAPVTAKPAAPVTAKPAAPVTAKPAAPVTAKPAAPAAKPMTAKPLAPAPVTAKPAASAAKHVTAKPSAPAPVMAKPATPAPVTAKPVVPAARHVTAKPVEPASVTATKPVSRKHSSSSLSSRADSASPVLSRKRSAPKDELTNELRKLLEHTSFRDDCFPPVTGERAAKRRCLEKDMSERDGMTYDEVRRLDLLQKTIEDDTTYGLSWKDDGSDDDDDDDDDDASSNSDGNDSDDDQMYMEM